MRFTKQMKICVVEPAALVQIPDSPIIISIPAPQEGLVAAAAGVSGVSVHGWSNNQV